MRSLTFNEKEARRAAPQRLSYLIQLQIERDNLYDTKHDGLRKVEHLESRERQLSAETRELERILDNKRVEIADIQFETCQITEFDLPGIDNQLQKTLHDIRKQTYELISIIENEFRQV